MLFPHFCHETSAIVGYSNHYSIVKGRLICCFLRFKHSFVASIELRDFLKFVFQVLFAQRSKMAALGFDFSDQIDTEMKSSSHDTVFSDVNNDGESADTSSQSVEGVTVSDFSP